MTNVLEIQTPDRSLEQRLTALQKANDIRSARAQLKRDVAGGRQAVERLIVEPPAYVETMKVMDLLLAIPKWGRVKVTKRLNMCKISPSKRIGGLTHRQRLELVACLPGAAARAEFEVRLRAWSE